MLIEHSFDPKQGYRVRTLENIKETEKQYRRTDDDKIGEYWTLLNKRDIGELRHSYSGNLYMYLTEEDLPHFKERVVSQIQCRHDTAKREYEKQAEALEKAKGGGTRGNDTKTA